MTANKKYYGKVGGYPTVEEVAEAQGMRYRYVEDKEEPRRIRCGLHLGPNSSAVRTEEPQETRVHRFCALCEKSIPARYRFCKECAIEVGVYGLLYKDWPIAVKFLVSDKRREAEVELSLGETEISLEEIDPDNYLIPSGADVTSPNFRETEVAFEYIDMSILKDYGLTEEEYEILTTDNMQLLAETLGIGYDALRKRKSRILKSLQVE